MEEEPTKPQPPTANMESAETPTMDQVLKDEASFIQNVSQFFNQEALSDVILKIADDKFFAHKFVLAKSSEVFRTMLYDKAWAHNTKEEVDLNETPECQAVFDSFLRYLYSAQVNMNTTSAVGILCLADKYNVDSLKALCSQYMVENSRSPKKQNALNWYSWAKALHLDSLIVQCTKCIAWNAQDIITSPEFVTMDIDFLHDMLQSSELIVSCEYSIWEACAKWLLHESRVMDLAENCRKLLPLVRFPQMVVPQLFQLEQSDLAQKTECREVLQQLLSQAYRFRALCPTQTNLGATFNEPFYLPRDYVSLTVDNVRMQNTLRFGIQVDVKMYKGAVPMEQKDGDWKVTYRKQNDSWNLQLYCHETAMSNNEARIQPSVLIYNEQEKVIQVHREQPHVLTRGNTITMQFSVEQPELAKNMATLIKPVPT